MWRQFNSICRAIISISSSSGLNRHPIQCCKQGLSHAVLADRIEQGFNNLFSFFVLKFNFVVVLAGVITTVTVSVVPG